MRSALLFLVVAAMGVLAVTVLLPILGVLFLLVAGLFVVAVGAMLSAPLLARLPWFRDRIFVEKRGRGRSIRFGRGGSAARPGRRDVDPDVIDVEGREVPEKDRGDRR
jgi:hypothetical protein